MTYRSFVAVLLSFTFFAPLLSSQTTRWEETPQVGIALGDISTGSLVNLGTLSTGGTGGIGWTGFLNGDKPINQTLNVSAGFLSYNYRFLSNTNNHEIGLSFPLHEGIYFGNSWRWNEGESGGYNGHLLYRPYRWISIGVKGESLNNNPWMDWGAGLRPLFFNDYWRSRFTVFYDARVDNYGNYSDLASGIRLMPVNGVELFGHWDFRTESFETGINLSWNRLMLGGSAAAAGEGAGQNGSIKAFLSAKPLPSISTGRKGLLVYDLAETITDTPIPFIGGRQRSLYDFLSDMNRILHSRDIDAILFDRQDFRTSFSNIIEIKQALTELKDAGKKIYFYSDGMNSIQYALAASVADEIFVNPRGIISLTGFSVTKFYLNDLLKKYGINVYNFRSHEYKTVFDSLSENQMSESQRQSLEAVYGDLQNELSRMIAVGRDNRLNEDLDKLFAEGYLMSSSKAKSAGLVDTLMYSDQLDEWIESNGYRVSTFSNIKDAVDYEWQKANRPNIAVIYARGNITMGEGTKGLSIGDESLADAIRRARRSPMIQAIVLRVDSGGGSALASDIVAREVALTSTGPNKKPIVVSMGSAAASGGYMISAPATQILATPATITGSIGVITLIPDISGLLDKLQITEDTVTTTQSADFPNVFRPLSDSEVERIRQLVMEDYDSFVKLVATHRNRSFDEIDEVAKGQIWTGTQGLERGLIDKLGGLRDAIAVAENILGTADARIVEINPGLLAWNFFGLPASLMSMLKLQPAEPKEILPETFREIIDFYKQVEQYEHGESLYLMPYTTKEMGLDSRE